MLNEIGRRVTGVGQSVYNGPVLNKMDVHCRLDGQVIRRSGSAEFDNKLKMALEVRRRFASVVGSDVVDAAEKSLRDKLAAGETVAKCARELRGHPHPHSN